MKTKTKRPANAKPQASVKARNKKFIKSSPGVRRVMIAEDAKEQVLAGKLIASPGTYSFLKAQDINNGTDVQKLLNEDLPQCHVCGLGALFVSAVRFRDDAVIRYRALRPTDNPFEGTALEGLKEFSCSQRHKIEMYFEEHWEAKYSDPKDRLLAILNNIIKNKGTFKP